MDATADCTQYDPRRFDPRLEVDAPVLVLIDGEPWCTQLADISANGCRVNRTSCMPVALNQFVRVFLLTEKARAASFCGRVAHVAPGYFGVAFQTEADSRRFDDLPDASQTGHPH